MHMIHMSRDEYLLCSGGGRDTEHRVQLGRSDGEIWSIGGKKGIRRGQLSVPTHMDVDNAGFVYVADAKKMEV